MATCRDVITLAMKLAKIVPPGDEPSADEAADGLICLQSMYDQWAAGGMFGRLTDVYKTENYEAQVGERVTAPSGVTVTFPALVDDLENGGDRVPRDLSCIETIVNGVRTLKVWDRTGWADLLNLGLSDTAPFASRNQAGFAAALATHGAFAAMFSDAEISPRVERLAAQFLGALSYKLGTTRDVAPGVYY